MYKIWICSLKSVEEREEAREGREEAREEDERNWLPDVKGITPCIASYETIPIAVSTPVILLQTTTAGGQLEVRAVGGKGYQGGSLEYYTLQIHYYLEYWYYGNTGSVGRDLKWEQCAILVSISSLNK